ncbi:hypothetical protein AHAS_Ahas18G0197700 [Arachis hypogaea]
MAWDLGMHKLIVEADSSEAIERIRRAIRENKSHDPIVRGIIEHHKRIWELKFQHCYREANACANWLARRSFQF